MRSRALYSHRVRLEIPETTQCCLFPGQVGGTTRDFILYPSLSLLTPSLSSLSLLTQVVAVEGINNYSGSLIPNAIYDQVMRSLLPAKSLLKGFSLPGCVPSAAQEDPGYCRRCVQLAYIMAEHCHSLPTGFSLLAAAGPFSTSDSLDMAPLNDIIRQVREEEPNVLLLVRVPSGQ